MFRGVYSKIKKDLQELKENAKFMYKTNWKNLNPENVNEMIQNNTKLMGILTKQNPEVIWPNLIMGLNEIINTLAPTTIIQCKANHIPYINDEVKEYIKDSETQLTKAIVSKSCDEWRAYKSMRNGIKKIVEKAKTNYYQNKLKVRKTMWSTLKDLAGDTKICTPNKIIVNGEYVTSPKKLAENLNEYFIKKVKEIRANFTEPKMDPI